MSSITPADRKAELERKKARLAAIREEKKRREDARKRLVMDADTSGDMSVSDSSVGAGTDVRKEAEDILKDLETKGYIPATPVQPPPVAASEESKSVEGSPSHMVYKSRGMVNLAKTDTVQVNFAPREQVNYNKTTQTLDSGDQRGGHHDHGFSFEWDDEFGGQPPLGTPEDVFDIEGSPLPGLSRLPNIELIRPAVLDVKSEKEEKDEKEASRELTDEEKQTICNSENFLEFFDKSSKIIERALAEDVDIYADYSQDKDEQEQIDIGAKLSLHRVFCDDKWSKGRCATCLDYCPQHPELLACSYNNNPDAPSDPDGIVLVWNAKFKKDTPEYIFHCQSRVVSTTFAKFHPNLILGGTYSGQVCLWDNRHHKKTPVQKSPLSTQAHTHPVYSLKVVGTQNAHNLVSISNDGKLCSWSLDMLSQPQDILELAMKQSKQVAVTSLSFPLNDVNNFVVGSEDGNVYSASRHGTKQGISDLFEGHCAPVTGVSCHAAVGQIDFSHLFMSSSFDWSVKLWSWRSQKPLYSFEDHQDYVLDVAWSPVHPALFACVDATGRLDLWNLNQDTEVPAATVIIDGRPALNKVMWMPTGLQLCVGDAGGKIWLYDVSDLFALPRGDDWSKLARVLLEMQQNNADTEELSSSTFGTNLLR